MDLLKEKKCFNEVQRNPYDKLYLVENVVKQRKKKGKIQYLIKWKGFSSKYNSWEPKSVVKYVTSTSAIAQQTNHCKLVSLNKASKKEKLGDLSDSKTTFIEKKTLKLSGNDLKLDKLTKAYPDKRNKMTTSTIEGNNSKQCDDSVKAKICAPKMSSRYHSPEVKQLRNGSYVSSSTKLVVPKLIKEKHADCVRTESKVEDSDQYTNAVQEAVTFISKVIDKHGKGFSSDDALVLAVLLYLQLTKKFDQNMEYVYKKVKTANLPMELYFQLKMHEPISDGKRSDKALLDKLMEEYGKLNYKY